jgi:hypothetical protein
MKAGITHPSRRSFRLNLLFLLDFWEEFHYVLLKGLKLGKEVGRA